MISQIHTLTLILLLLFNFCTLSLHAAPIAVAKVAKAIAPKVIDAVRDRVQKSAKDQIDHLTHRKGAGEGKEGAFGGAKVVYLLLPVMGNAMTLDQLPAINPTAGSDGSTGSTGASTVASTGVSDSSTVASTGVSSTSNNASIAPVTPPSAPATPAIPATPATPATPPSIASNST